MTQTAILYPVFVQVALTFFLQVLDAHRAHRSNPARRAAVQGHLAAAAELAAARDADLERVSPSARDADPLLCAHRVSDDHEPGGRSVRGPCLAVRGCAAVSRLHSHDGRTSSRTAFSLTRRVRSSLPSCGSPSRSASSFSPRAPLRLAPLHSRIDIVRPGPRIQAAAEVLEDISLAPSASGISPSRLGQEASLRRLR